jgi:hypothetical protein
VVVGNGQRRGSGGGQQAGPPAGQQAGPLACTPPAAGEGWSRITLNSDPTAQEQLAGGSLLFEVQDAHWRASVGGWQVVLTTSMQNQTSGPEYHGSWRYQYLVVAQQSFSKVTCFSGGSVPVPAGLVDDALIGFQVGCKPVGAIEVVLEDNKGRIRVTKDLAPGGC